MRKDEFPLVDKIRVEAYRKGRTDAVDEAEAKIKEYASIWMSYTDGMTKEQIAQEALNTAKDAMIKILEQIKEQKNEVD